MTPKMIEIFKKEHNRFKGLHKNVNDYYTKNNKKQDNILNDELLTLLPGHWKYHDVKALFFEDDPTQFKRYDKRGKLVASWDELTPKQKDIILVLHGNATKFTTQGAYVFNARHEEEDPEKGRDSYPIVYNMMKFPFMWDEMIHRYRRRRKEIQDLLNDEALKDPKTEELKNKKFNLKQENKIIISILSRAEYIRDRKDDYPVDMSTGTVLSLATDAKHAKHISNEFNILEGRYDKGSYFEYLNHQSTNLARKLLTIQLIRSLKKAKSDEARNYILQLYKVLLYQSDTSSGLSYLKWDSDTVSKTVSMIPGVNVSAAQIDRNMKNQLKWVSGLLLRGQGTAVLNYTAIWEKIMAVGLDRTIDALKILEMSGKDLERLISLSGVVDFKDFFSSSLTNDANNLGAENKHVMAWTDAMITYWAKVAELRKKIKHDTPTGKRRLNKEIKEAQTALNEQFGRTFSAIPSEKRLIKRRKIQKQKHRENLLNKWVNYAINKEYEAAPYIEEGAIKTTMSVAEKIARFEKIHMPTMGKTEQSLRALSFIIGIMGAQRVGALTKTENISDYLKNPVLLQEALKQGRRFTEMLDFGLSRQNLGWIAWSNVGASFTQFKTWPMQKLSRDLDVLRLAYESMKNEDIKGFSPKAVLKMLQALQPEFYKTKMLRESKLGKKFGIKKKYSLEQLRESDPNLAAFVSLIWTQGLWTVINDFIISGPINIIPVLRQLSRATPGIRTMGGATSDLISLSLLPASILFALQFGEGEDEIEKLWDFYSRKTFLGVGATWSINTIIAVLSFFMDTEEPAKHIMRVGSILLPPLLRPIVWELLPTDD